MHHPIIFAWIHIDVCQVIKSTKKCFRKQRKNSSTCINLQVKSGLRIWNALIKTFQSILGIRYFNSQNRFGMNRLRSAIWNRHPVWAVIGKLYLLSFTISTFWYRFPWIAAKFHYVHRITFVPDLNVAHLFVFFRFISTAYESNSHVFPVRNVYVSHVVIVGLYGRNLSLKKSVVLSSISLQCF